MSAKVTTRPAHAEDARRIAEIHVAAWREGFPFLSGKYLDKLTPETAESRWAAELASEEDQFLLAQLDNDVAGFVQARVLSPSTGEIKALYVDPVFWRRGVGRQLLTTACAWITMSGASSATVWTASASQQARAFYASHGWRLTGRTVDQDLGGAVTITEVEYERTLRATSTYFL